MSDVRGWEVYDQVGTGIDPDLRNVQVQLSVKTAVSTGQEPMPPGRKPIPAR